MPGFVEVGIRSILIIFGLFFITKMLGKKQLSALSFFEYIVGITVGDIAGTLSFDRGLGIAEGVTSILIWTIIPIVVSSISLKSKKFRDFVEGKPTTFIESGKILEANLRKEKYSVDELLEQLHKKGVFKVADVEFASLDTNGELSVLLKKEKQPVLTEDVIIDPINEGVPFTIIADGKIDYEAMVKANINEEWLKQILASKNLSIKEVFLGQVDSNKQLSIDLFDEY